MDEKTQLTAFAVWYLRRAAVLVQATEAAMFIARGRGKDRSFDCLTHVRPLGASDALLEAARKAFIELLTPCVEQVRDAVIELRNPGAQHPRLQEINRQYCLIVLIKGDDPEPLAIATFIVRCADQVEAKKKLRIVALQPPRNWGK